MKVAEQAKIVQAPDIRLGLGAAVMWLRRGKWVRRASWKPNLYLTFGWRPRAGMRETGHPGLIDLHEGGGTSSVELRWQPTLDDLWASDWTCHEPPG